MSELSITPRQIRAMARIPMAGRDGSARWTLRSPTSQEFGKYSLLVGDRILTDAAGDEWVIPIDGGAAPLEAVDNA
jgi:hypothetical protein